MKPSPGFADVILAERGLYKETEGKGGGGGGATGRRNAFAATGENRNNTLISLRGKLFNLGYGDDEIREMLIARNEQFIEPLPMAELESSVLKPKPNFVRHPAGRHASVPRLRVAPPEELGTYADEVIKKALIPVTEAVGPAWPDDPEDKDSAWGDMKPAMEAADPAAEILGGLGDLDLVDYGRADSIVRNEVLPSRYASSISEELLNEKNKEFTSIFRAGWNKGARTGHEVPEELQAALDTWHPPCPLEPEDIEQHRLPPAQDHRWPVQNHVSKADDRGNARRLKDHFGDLIRFDDVDLKAYAHDGQRWLDTVSGGQGLAGEFADKMIGSLATTEAMSLSVVVHRITQEGDPVSDRGDFWFWLNAQQSDAKRTAMLRCASTMEDMRISAARFDADTQWLNTLSGELDLGRAEVEGEGQWHCAEPIVFHAGRHYPEHFHSRITGAAFDESAACPEWEKAVKAWLGDDEMVTYAGKLLAASLRGMTTLKVIPLPLGDGDSGKSTFLEVVMAVLGSYATAAAPSILRKGTGGSTLTDDVAELRGYRFVSTTETEGAEQTDEPKLKRLSGGDRQRARGLYQSSSEFDVTFLLWGGTNFMPRLSSEDSALWRRFAPIEFPYMWTESGLTPDGKKCNRADPHLKRKLLAEAPGILAWIVRHLQLLYTEGLREPQAVTDKREELRAQQDTVGQWLAEAEAASSAEPDAWDPLLTANLAEYDRTLRLTQVYQHYRAWMKDKSNPVGRQPFRAALKNHGYVITKNGNIEKAHSFGHQETEARQCTVCKEKFR